MDLPRLKARPTNKKLLFWRDVERNKTVRETDGWEICGGPNTVTRVPATRSTKTRALVALWQAQIKVNCGGMPLWFVFKNTLETRENGTDTCMRNSECSESSSTRCYEKNFRQRDEEAGRRGAVVVTVLNATALEWAVRGEPMRDERTGFVRMKFLVFGIPHRTARIYIYVAMKITHRRAPRTKS